MIIRHDPERPLDPMMLLSIVDNSKWELFLFWVATYFTGYTMRWLTRKEK